MTEDTKKGIWHHLVAGARDILVISAVLTLMSGIAVTMTRPFWEPFASIPENIKELQINQAELKSVVAQGLRPQIVEFEGHAQIIGKKVVKPGDTVTFLYFLRRNASCATQVERKFFDVDRGITVTTATVMANQAPVTDEFLLFRVDVKIPNTLPDGRYSYSPTLNPLECGVYDRMTVVPSEIFEVRRGD